MAKGFILLSEAANVGGSNFKKITSGISLFGKAAAQSIIQNKSLSSTLTGMGVSAQAASAMMSAATLGVSLAISAAVIGISAYKKHWDDLRNSVSESVSTFNQSSESIEGNISTLESLEERFKTLSKGVSSHMENISLTAEEYDELKGIIEQLIQINPELKNQIDNENISLLEKNNLIREQIELQKELQSENNKVLISSGNDVFKVAAKDSKDLVFDLKNAQELQDAILNAQKGIQKEISYSASLMAQKMGIDPQININEHGLETYYLPIDISETDIHAIEGKVSDLQNQIKEKYSSVDLVMTAVINEQTSYKNLSEPLQSLVDKISSDTDWTKFGGSFSEASDYITDAIKVIGKDADKVNDILFETAKLTDISKTGSVDNWAQSFDKAINNIIARLKEAPELAQVLGLDNLSANELKLEIPVVFGIDTSQQDNAVKQIEDITRLVQESGIYDTNDKNKIDSLNESLSELNPERIDLISDYFKAANVDGKQAVATLIETDDSLKSIDPSQLEKTLQALAGIGATDADSAVEMMAEEIKKLSESMATASKSITTIQSALDEFKESSNFDFSSLDSLADNFDNLKDPIEDFKAGLISSTELVNILEKEVDNQKIAYIDAIQQKLLAENDFTNQVYTAESALIKNLVNMYGGNAQSWANMLNTMGEANSLAIRSFGENWQSFFSTLADAMDGVVSMYEATTEVSARGFREINEMEAKGIKISTPSKADYQSAKAYQDAVKSFDSLKNVNFSGVKTTKVGGSGSSSGSPSSGTSNTPKDMLKENLDNTLKSLENQVFFAADKKDYDRQVELYKQMQNEVHKTAQSYRQKGYKETSLEIQELQKKWIEYKNKTQDVHRDMFSNMKEEFAKSTRDIENELSSLDFSYSIIDETDYSAKKDNINDKIETRLRLNKELIDQLNYLEISTDDIAKSTEWYQEILDKTNKDIQNNVKLLYDLAQAMKDTAQAEISAVEKMQEDIIQMLKARYNEEMELENKAVKAKVDALEKEKKLLKEKHELATKNLDNELKMLRRMWEEEDSRADREEKIDNINELQEKIAALHIASESGDAEAISRVEDYKSQLEKLQKDLAKNDEQDRRKQIENSLNDKKTAIDEQYNQKIKGVDANIELYNEELDAFKEINDEKLKNANLYKEAHVLMQKGMNQELLDDLWQWNENYGAGLGITREHIYNNLTAQFEEAQKALKNLMADIAILAEKDMFSYGSYSPDQYKIIEKMKANSDAWHKATTSEERSRLAVENEELGASLGLVKDSSAGVWYTDESKTAKAYDALNQIKEVQIKSIEEIMLKYDEEHKKFVALQDEKGIKVDNFSKISSGIINALFITATQALSTYGNNFTGVISFMQFAIDDFIGRVQTAIVGMDKLNSYTEKTASMNIPVKNASTLVSKNSTETTTRYAKGGLNREAGLKFLDSNEQVLTDKQTESFSKLVDNLDKAVKVTDNLTLQNGTLKRVEPLSFKTMDGIEVDMDKLFAHLTLSNGYNTAQQMQETQNQSFQNSLQNIPNVTNARNVHADFNFYGSITQEAMPQVKKVVNDAIYELKREIPKIATEGQRNERKRFGSSW